MSASIREQILGISNLEKFFKDQTSSIKPYSIKEIVDMLGDNITGHQQVLDFTKSRYKKGDLSRMRESKCYKYWWTENVAKPASETTTDGAPAPIKKPLDYVPEITSPVETIVDPNVPEIKVNSRENFVSIKTPTCKITIEY
jgi:hypothetical protein